MRCVPTGTNQHHFQRVVQFFYHRIFGCSGNAVILRHGLLRQNLSRACASAWRVPMSSRRPGCSRSVSSCSASPRPGCFCGRVIQTYPMPPNWPTRAANMTFCWALARCSLWILRLRPARGRVSTWRSVKIQPFLPSCKPSATPTEPPVRLRRASDNSRLY